DGNFKAFLGLVSTGRVKFKQELVDRDVGHTRGAAKGFRHATEVQLGAVARINLHRVAPAQPRRGARALAFQEFEVAPLASRAVSDLARLRNLELMHLA